MIKLVKPSETYSKQIREYRSEFLEHGDELHGTAGLKDIENIAQWLTKLDKNSCEKTVAEGLVPSTTYLAIRQADNRIVGMIDIRHRLNDFLLKFGGHIGYSVRRSERRKGYATEMLRLALVECSDKLGLQKVMITCDKENISSSKTILANKGVLESEIQDKDKIMQRYWVNLEK